MPSIALTDTAHDTFHRDSSLPVPSRLCPVCLPNETIDDYAEAVAFLTTAVRSGSATAVIIGSWWAASTWEANDPAPHEMGLGLPCVWCGGEFDPEDADQQHAYDCEWVAYTERAR
jgi:hypothetical protein